ncbi:MAG: undecaprenyl-diphosphate phosphatase [Clostridia bacterium]|nr:undecaprenyl-diphosphate phosphatase [Clostridia bacterium]MBQ8566890.1 undecaprenyl-diphosphate phosphatase [Clostridia bacterium]
MIIEAIKAFFIGIVQGITEWLPVSSTGHMILFNEFVKMDVSPEFFELFEVVIQFGSILAVLVLFFDKLNPFSRKKDEAMKKKTWTLWIRVIIAVLPAAIIGLLLDDWFQAKFYNYVSVAVALIFYGILFIVIERRNKNKTMIYNDVYDIDGATALKIGIFQVLSIIPGTSRSGSTILGASVIGVSRPAAAEFSFFLAIPVMLGASAYKVLKYIVKVGVALTSTEIMALIVGTVTAFAVSLIVIRFLMNFVRKHSFESFGWYRIVLGIIVLGYNFVKIVVS